MASETDICNMALYRCGVSTTIANLTTESSKEARICKLFYPQRRDSLLQDLDWNFARRRATLALLVETPPTNWSYVYALPADFIAMRGIVIPGARHPLPAIRQPYEIADGKLLTDLEGVEIVYTARVTDTAKFDPLFVDLLSVAMVPDLSIGLSIKGDFVQLARASYQQFFSQAAASNFNSGHDVDLESDFVTVR